MADTAAAPAPSPPLAPSQPSPVLPGADQVKSSSEMKEDASKPETWPFAEPQPLREDQVRNAVNFLSHPKVRGTPVVQRFSFLERKGLTREEIEEAFRRCPDPPTSEATKPIAPSEGKVPAQAQSGGSHQAVVSAQPQPVQQYTSGPIVPARSGSNWSQLILGAGLIAAAGAGTGYFFQKVLAPKLRAWLRDVMLEEKKPTDSKKGQGEGPKLTPLEEAVGAAAAAANAAAAAAAEVANTSREVLKMQTEEWQYLRALIKTLDSKTEDLKSTLTSMSKNSQDAQEHVVSAAHAHADDTDQEMGSTWQQASVQNRGGPLGRQGWVPPPVPRTVMPGAASAIRYQKPASVDESKRASVAEEKEVDSRQPPPLLQTWSLDSTSSIRLQNPVRVDESKPTIFAEEKEITAQTTFELPKAPSVAEVAAEVAQTTFELPKMPKVAEVAEITSIDKEIPSSSVEDWAGDAA